MEIGLFFSCLYSSQEIRLTDVPAILMATSSHHSFLSTLSQLHLFSPFLLISLSPSPFPLSLSPVLDVFSPRRREGNFHIESQPGSGDLDLTPSQSPMHGKWKCIHVCWMECITQMRAVFASWKCSAIAACCCWQTNWVHPGKNTDFILLLWHPQKMQPNLLRSTW